MTFKGDPFSRASSTVLCIMRPNEKVHRNFTALKRNETELLRSIPLVYGVKSWWTVGLYSRCCWGNGKPKELSWLPKNTFLLHHEKVRLCAFWKKNTPWLDGHIHFCVHPCMEKKMKSRWTIFPKLSHDKVVINKEAR